MQCSSVMLSSFEMKCTTDTENLKYFISENSKIIPDFFLIKNIRQPLLLCYSLINSSVRRFLRELTEHLSSAS